MLRLRELLRQQLLWLLRLFQLFRLQHHLQRRLRLRLCVRLLRQLQQGL